MHSIKILNKTTVFSKLYGRIFNRKLNFVTFNVINIYPLYSAVGVTFKFCQLIHKCFDGLICIGDMQLLRIPLLDNKLWDSLFFVLLAHVVIPYLYLA